MYRVLTKGDIPVLQAGAAFKIILIAECELDCFVAH